MLERSDSFIDPADNEKEQRNEYHELARRAYLFIEQQGGRASEAAVIQGVFGVRGKTEIWSGIIQQVLNDPFRFQKLSCGDWILASQADLSTPLHRLEYVVIDTETTGLQPGRARMIEVAAIKLKEGRKTGTYQSLVNPHRRIPGFISNMTGITDEMTSSAPGFGKISNQLMEFIGTAIIVGHNVHFDVSFLNYELSALDRSTLVNETIDTISLAVRLFPGLRRPNLDRLAAHLGLPAKNRHRAFGDASITADAFLKLLEVAGENGFKTLEDLRNGRVRQYKIPENLPIPKEPEIPAPEIFESETLDARPERIVSSRRRWQVSELPGLTQRATAHARDVLSRGLIRNLPLRPGVYLMKDVTGLIIYIGKAKNLRDRVSSYYSQPLGYTRKLDGLVESIAQIDHIVTGSELEALLLESRLIKKHLPRYNTQLRNFEAYPFIKINMGQRFPRVQASREIQDDGARYFGPFKSRRAVDTTVEVIEQMFPVRNCTRIFEATPKGKKRKQRPPCLRLHTNHCPGPCSGQDSDSDNAEYLKIIEEVISFLSGEKEAVLDEIWQRINRAVGERNFEKAAALRNVLSQVQMVIASQTYLARAVERNHFIICLPSTVEGFVELLCIFFGRLGKQIQIKTGCDPNENAVLLDRTWRELVEKEHNLAATQPGWGKKGGRVIGQDVVDEINIISRWIYSHSDDPAIIPVPVTAVDQDFWVEILKGIDDLSFEDESLE